MTVRRLAVAVVHVASVVLAACAGPSPVDPAIDGAATDDAGRDGGTVGLDAALDGSVGGDAHVAGDGDLGVDVGLDATESLVDGGASDVGTDAQPDLVSDSGPPDASADAATSDAALSDGGADAGPPLPTAPVGAAVDVSDGGCLTDPVRGVPYTTCATCALDSSGNFWCWGRWGTTAAGQTVRLFGTGFESAGGTCAVRSDGTVACAEIVAGTMPDVPGLVLDRLAKGSGYYDDTSFGRGRHVCGFQGTTVHCFHEYTGATGGTGVPPMAAAITTPTCAGLGCVDYAIAGPADDGVAMPYDGFDAAGICRSQIGMASDCRTGLAGAYSILRAPGTNHEIDDALDCALDTGRVGCYSRSDSLRTHDLPGFSDYAITWLSAYGAPGVCVAYVDPSLGDHVRCFADSGTGTRISDVNW